jgi:hypothetical protein
MAEAMKMLQMEIDIWYDAIKEWRRFLGWRL